MNVFHKHSKDTSDPGKAMEYADDARAKAVDKDKELTPLINRLEGSVKRNKIFESILTTIANNRGD